MSPNSQPKAAPQKAGRLGRAGDSSLPAAPPGLRTRPPDRDATKLAAEVLGMLEAGDAEPMVANQRATQRFCQVSASGKVATLQRACSAVDQALLDGTGAHATEELISSIYQRDFDAVGVTLALHYAQAARAALGQEDVEEGIRRGTRMLAAADLALAQPAPGDPTDEWEAFLAKVRRDVLGA